MSIQQGIGMVLISHSTLTHGVWVKKNPLFIIPLFFFLRHMLPSQALSSALKAYSNLTDFLNLPANINPFALQCIMPSLNQEWNTVLLIDIALSQAPIYFTVMNMNTIKFQRATCSWVVHRDITTK